MAGETTLPGPVHPPSKTDATSRGRPAAWCSADDTDPTPGVSLQTWLEHVRYARTGDPRVLSRLVAEYERYALALARRLHRSREPREDLDQVAREALVVALQRFEPELGIPFPSYGTPTTLGALRRHYRDHGWLIRVPRRVHELAVASRTVTERLTTELGRSPSMIELADALEVDIDELIDAHEAVFARESASLDAPGHDGHNSLADRLGRPDAQLGLVEDRAAVAQTMSVLDDQGRELLRLYYVDGCSQCEIAERLGVSQMQVSRRIAAVLRRLRHHVGQH